MNCEGEWNSKREPEPQRVKGRRTGEGIAKENGIVKGSQSLRESKDEERGKELRRRME